MNSENEYFYDLFIEYENQKETEEDLGSIADDKIRQSVVTSTDWTTETILNQIDKGNILLNPNYQRRDAWTPTRKSRFIESLILGLPIPQVVLAESNEKRGEYLVIDGKQRLLSIRQFASNDEDSKYDTLMLKGLDVRVDLNGKCLADLRDDPQLYEDLSAFENQPIRTVIIKNWPNETFLYHVFLRLNTGSVSLSPQELRQALHPGPFVTFADEESGKSPALREILKNTKPDFRMRDAELLVRYYAFGYFLQNYTGNLKSFLDHTCKTLNSDWPNIEDQIRNDLQSFEEAHKAIKVVFNIDAYRKWTPEGFESRFNRAIFDIMIYVFRKDNARDTLKQNKDQVVDIFKDLCANDAGFLTSIEQTTKSTTATYTRFSNWCNRLNSSFNMDLQIPRITRND